MTVIRAGPKKSPLELILTKLFDTETSTSGSEDVTDTDKLLSTSEAKNSTEVLPPSLNEVFAIASRIGASLTGLTVILIDPEDVPKLFVTVKSIKSEPENSGSGV